ncbi:MAG: leucine-rich repeat protein [Lachnospiraceae bacterium]|nr:leucine-rich repeat protein [Lachnospiraceae bacterium]
MKKKPFVYLLSAILSIAMIGTSFPGTVSVNADGDRDKDGIMMFSELSEGVRNEIRRGYSPGGKFGFEMIFMMNDPYMMDLSGGHSLTVPLYPLMARRAICYYRNSTVRNDELLYPRNTTRWFVTDTWMEDGEWVAAVNCTARTSRLTTPETIRYDGHTCKVVEIDLANPDVRELTITDNIELIRRCQCPRLQTFVGGRRVRYIGRKAFMNDVSLVNMPYLPSLVSIGEFAFLGCLNLQNVLLPPSVEYMLWNSFGWYDVVLGNYDTDAPREPYLADLREEDPEYLQSGIYLELEKRKNMTLYAAKGTNTWKTLEELFGSGDPRCSQISYAEKDAYPGHLPNIDIDKEIEEEVERWLPKGMTVEDIDWGEKQVAADVNRPVTVDNALTANQKVCLKWLEKLLLKGEINEDMFLALIGSVVGVNPIPKEFTAVHLNDPEYSVFEVEYMNAALVYYKAYKAKQAKKPKTAAATESALFTQRSNLVTYVVNDLNYLKEAADAVADLLGVEQSEAVKYGGLITQIAGNLNRMLGYVEKGDSWTAAAAKTFETAVFVGAAGEAAAANPMLALYEGAIYALFGTSDAADAASIISTGTHTVELISDLSLTPFIEAWYAASNYPDNKKWDMFYTVWKEEINKTLSDLLNTQKRAYGQTVTNVAYIFNMLMDDKIQQEIFEGYIQQFNEGTLFSYFLKDVYDVTIKNNRVGQIVEGLVVNNWFTQTMLDWTEAYYSKSQSVLNDR